MAPKRKSRSTAAAAAAAGAQDEGVATTTTPAPASMAGAVVFSLPHLRHAVFAYHADSILERRKEVLGEWQIVDVQSAVVLASHHVLLPIHVCQEQSNDPTQVNLRRT